MSDQETKPRTRSSFVSNERRERVYSPDGAVYTMTVGTLRDGVPAWHHDPDHPHDDGWFYPILRQNIVVHGSTEIYRTRITQAEHQKIKAKA